jgi:hypothetical protein
VGDDAVAEAEDDFAEDALPPIVEEDAVPLDLNKLFAWHRPRKQKVRESQWVALTKGLLTKLQQSGALAAQDVQLPDGNVHAILPEVRYLTLPGIDYLDVRLLGEAANELGFRLTSLGFLDEAMETRALARARVRQEGLVQAGFISNRSVTLPRALESICWKDGDSLGQLKRQGPYHVVNIDACGSIAPINAAQATRLIEAIHKIVEYQISASRTRWLFFLTVDVRAGNLDGATFEALCDAIRQNAAASADFAEAARDFFDPSKLLPFEDALQAAKQKDERSTLDVFMLGAAKWLLHLVVPKLWTVRMKHSYCYSTTGVEDGPATMCALAFEFHPPVPGLPDALGASLLQPAVGGPPGDASMQIVAAAGQVQDLDRLMEADDKIVAQLNLITRKLLEEAGYHAEALQPFEDPNRSAKQRRFPDAP